MHYDHSKDRYVKGINQVSALLVLGNACVPVACELVEQTHRSELKTKKAGWKSERTKNEMFRHMVRVSAQNKIRFNCVLCGSRYTNSENIKHVLQLQKHLIGAVKSNMEVAVSLADKKAGKFAKLKELELEPGLRQVYIRALEEPVLICKGIFINGDGPKGEQCLLSTSLALTFQQIITTYQKRWGVEEYHESLKQHTSIGKAPLKTLATQASHLFASLCAFVKLERIKTVEKQNHFALKTKLYIKATQAACKELALLKAQLA